jgi:cation:H+ antiporter
MQSALFGATFLAAVTAPPEVSTGLESMRLRDYRMAVSDIFGGNAFLPVLFLMATVLSGRAVLPDAQAFDLYLTGLAILLTAIYPVGLIVASPRQWLRMGIDSLLVALLYLLGVAGLL